MTVAIITNGYVDLHDIEQTPKGVQWHDLAPMNRTDTFREVCLPLPWLLTSWALYASPIWFVGPVASFMFFLCALRLNHEAIHNNLGLPRWGDHIILHTLSFLMGASNHAVAHGHMVHHKYAMGPEDFEGKCGHMSFWEVLIYGPRFTFDINFAAWVGSKPRQRRRIVIDWALNATLIAISLGSGLLFLVLHIIAMAFAHCFTAMFAVWITHQGADAHGVVARSQRGFLARLAYLMFYHREHHLFPKVPVRRLPELATRLDHLVKGYAASRAPVIPLFDRHR